MISCCFRKSTRQCCPHNCEQHSGCYCQRTCPHRGLSSAAIFRPVYILHSPRARRHGPEQLQQILPHRYRLHPCRIPQADAGQRLTPSVVTLLWLGKTNRFALRSLNARSKIIPYSNPIKTEGETSQPRPRSLSISDVYTAIPVLITSSYSGDGCSGDISTGSISVLTLRVLCHSFFDHSNQLSPMEGTTTATSISLSGRAYPLLYDPNI